jgi:glyoxylase-like metal-dependent hydrolase (beta-lactamase superfamily II)
VDRTVSDTNGRNLLAAAAEALVLTVVAAIVRASWPPRALGVEIRHVFETHVHNDYVTGGHALAKATGAASHVNAADPVTFDGCRSAMAGSVTGNQVAAKVDAAKLTAAFVVLLAAVAVYTAARSVPQLV